MDIFKLSKLARIKLDESESSTVKRDIETILQYVKVIQEVDTVSVDPLLHPHDLAALLRPDVAFIRSESDSLKILDSAPETLGRGFKVPPIV